MPGTSGILLGNSVRIGRKIGEREVDMFESFRCIVDTNRDEMAKSPINQKLLLEALLKSAKQATKEYPAEAANTSWLVIGGLAIGQYIDRGATVSSNCQ